VLTFPDIRSNAALALFMQVFFSEAALQVASLASDQAALYNKQRRWEKEMLYCPFARLANLPYIDHHER
jgi:hypothetical protein